MEYIINVCAYHIYNGDFVVNKHDNLNDNASQKRKLYDFGTSDASLDTLFILIHSDRIYNAQDVGTVIRYNNNSIYFHFKINVNPFQAKID